MIGVGIIGYGYWGPNLVRNFADNPDTSVLWVVDQNAERLKAASLRYPGISVGTDPVDLIGDPAVDCVVIATPVSTHFDLAMAALAAGKHVLVEKPMTQTVEQGRRLVEEAQKRNLTLMVDHTFIYTGAVRHIRGMMDAGDIGDVLYYDSTRINLGLFQHDVDVIWDLAVHDLSILNYLLRDFPVTLSATGVSHIDGGQENVGFISLFFPTGCIAHINVNWLSPVKIRRTVIGGSRKMIVYDDLEPTEKIKVYDKGITITKDPDQIRDMLVGYRIGDMWAPKVEGSEALAVEVQHLVDCIKNGTMPETDGVMGLGVVALAEAASASMRAMGQPIQLSKPSEL